MVSTHAALIYTMVMVSAVDRDMGDAELSLIGQIVKRLPVFDDYNIDLLTETTGACAETLSADDGLEAALDLVNNSLPDSLKETGYALAVEIAAADRRVEPTEVRLLDMIRRRLGIDQLAAVAIERGAKARYATA